MHPSLVRNEREGAYEESGHRIHPAFPHAMVYDLWRALPGDRLVDTVIDVKEPVDLKPAPRVSGPHAFVVRKDDVVRITLHVHRSPPRVRDVRETPLIVGIGCNIS